MKRVIKSTSNISHLFSVGQKVRCRMDGKMYDGVVKDSQEDHIIVDIPGISDHCRFDEDMLGDVYPDYNF